MRGISSRAHQKEKRGEKARSEFLTGQTILLQFASMKFDRLDDTMDAAWQGKEKCDHCMD